ncbi:MAG: carboxypeptidase-like regulatory domain-containing protein [Acidobacteriota bacterium]
MKLYLYKFLTITLVITFSNGAARSQSVESTADVPKTGTLSGRVVNESGQPMANALVVVRGYRGGQSRTTTSDSEGSFQLSGLDPVAYLVSAYFPTYVSAPRDPDVSPIGYYLIGDTVRLELIKGGVITGTVTRPAGEPVVAVLVRAYMVRDGTGQPPRYGAPFREQTTDDRGVYRIYGLPPGTYLVSAGGGSRPRSDKVDAYDTDAPTYAPSSARDAAMEVSVRSGEESANVDIRYRREAGHAVSGVASSTVALNQPPGFNVILSSIFNGASQASYSSYQSPGARGFSFYGVADGDYDVTAQMFTPAGEWTISEPRRIKVRGSDVAGIELITRPLGSITGHMVLEESKAPECKDKRRPVFGETLVTPWHNEKIAARDQPQFLWSLGGPTFPDQDGHFAIRSLAPGQYRFNARPMAKYWYLKSITWPSSVIPTAKVMPPNRLVDAARNWTTLKSGERLAGLTVTIAAGAASIHGQIDLAEGQKLPPRLFVYLVPAEREQADDVLRYFATVVLADGTFAQNNLAPGRYWLLAQPVGESDSNILSKLRLPDEAEARAKVRHGAEAARTEIELRPCQNIPDYRLGLSLR